jgi:hypothetical protein
LDLHFAAPEQIIEPLVARAVQHAVDLVEALVPLFFQRSLASQARSRYVSGIEITVANDFNEVDAFDLFVDQFEYGRTKITGDAAVSV